MAEHVVFLRRVGDSGRGLFCEYTLYFCLSMNGHVYAVHPLLQVSCASGALCPGIWENSIGYYFRFFEKCFRIAGNLYFPSFCGAVRYIWRVLLGFYWPKFSCKRVNVLYFCAAMHASGNYLNKSWNARFSPEMLFHIQRKQSQPFDSRFSSISRRINSPMEIPNRMASFWSHFIWGAVKTTDRFSVMGSIKAPFKLLVKRPA